MTNPTTKAPWIIAGAVAIGGITAVLAWYNAAGWLHRQLPLLAAFAVLTEVVAFLMGVVAEQAGSRGKGQWKRRFRVACCLIILVGCEAFNGFGTHQAWEHTLAERAETLVAPQRNAIAAAETRLRASIDAADAAILAAQARIDAVAKPNCDGAGPLTCGSRTAAWEAQTAPDRADLERNRAEKTRLEQEFRDLDRTVKAPEPPVSEAFVTAFLVFLAFVKVTGLWAIGVGVSAMERPRSTAPTGTRAEENGTASDNVVPFFRNDEERRALVRALRAQDKPVSFRAIEKRYGIPIATAHRWCK